MAGLPLTPAKRRPTTGGAVTPPVKPIRGMFAGNSPDDLNTWITAQGVDIPLGHQFLDAAKWTDVATPWGHTEWAAWVAAKAGRRYSTSLCLNAAETTGDLSSVVGGGHDADYKSWATSLQSHPELRNAIIRLGWEFNTSGHSWSIVDTDASLAAYQSAYARVAAIIKANAPGVILEWCPNVGTQVTTKTFAQMYPTAAHPYIDVIGIGAYDYMWGSTTAGDGVATPFAERWAWLTEGTRGAGYNGLADQVRLARAKGKMLGHTEWGLWPYDSKDPHGTTGTDPRFIRKLARWHRVHGYQYEIYNNVLTDGHDHRLATYPDSLAAYKEVATSSAWLPDDKA